MMNLNISDCPLHEERLDKKAGQAPSPVFYNTVYLEYCIAVCEPSIGGNGSSATAKRSQRLSLSLIICPVQQYAVVMCILQYSR